MKYMLDTNMCIYAQKKNENVIAKLKEHWEEGLAISSITLAELEYGVKASAAPEKNSIALFCVYTEFGIDSMTAVLCYMYQSSSFKSGTRSNSLVL